MIWGFSSLLPAELLYNTFRGEGYNIPLYDAIIQHKPVELLMILLPFIPANIHHETAIKTYTKIVQLMVMIFCISMSSG